MGLAVSILFGMVLLVLVVGIVALIFLKLFMLGLARKNTVQNKGV